jgi:predicted metal-dependent HD superfamily phosphohydrolase
MKLAQPIAHINYNALSEKARHFVTSFMEANKNMALLYHTSEHTESVVRVARELAKHYRLDERETFVITVAAWFHDLGYYIDIANHWKASAEKASEFLKNYGVDEETVTAVEDCILATKIPQAPKNHLEQIVCDADLSYFGSENFSERNILLMRELQALNRVHISLNEWRDCTIQLLGTHQYHTNYGKENFAKRKKQNLEKIRKRNKESNEDLDPIKRLLQAHLNEQGLDGKKSLDRERTTQTMFRITSNVSQRLSEQADTKAHILISVNAIIISVIFTMMARNLESFSFSTIPVMFFLVVNLLTITFSILATRPSVPPGTFNPDDVKTKKVNLLFFGNFYKMNFDDYSKGMFMMLGDRHYLYTSLIRNLYELGRVLGRKYRHLKVAYNIFMYGIIVSVITFIIAHFLP